MIEKQTERINNLKERLEKRKEMKDQLISERFNELTGDENQDIKW